MPKFYRPPNPAAFVVKALIIYDDFDLAARASITLRRAAKYSNSDILLHLKVWRTDVMRLRPTHELAMLDAIDAQLIIFALNPAAKLPDGLLEWLDQWAEQRQIPDATLAAVSHENSPELSIFAHRHGLNFIVDAQPARKNDSALFAKFLPASKPLVTTFLPRFITEKLQASYRGWGINE